MHLTDETIQKLSKELQPTIDELKRCLERSELNKTQALSVLLVLSAMYLAHVVIARRKSSPGKWPDTRCWLPDRWRLPVVSPSGAWKFRPSSTGLQRWPRSMRKCQNT